MSSLSLSLSLSHAHKHTQTNTGLLPYNFLCVQSGLMLAELRGVAIFDPTSISLLVVGTVLLLATGLGMRYFHSRLEQTRISSVARCVQH